LTGEPVGGVEGSESVVVGDEDPAGEEGGFKGEGAGGGEGFGVTRFQADVEFGGHDAARGGAAGFRSGAGGEIGEVIKDGGKGAGILGPIGASELPGGGFETENGAAAPGLAGRDGTDPAVRAGEKFVFGEANFGGMATVRKKVFGLGREGADRGEENEEDVY